MRFTIPVNIADAWTENRNGFRPIKEVGVHAFGSRVIVSGIGSSGKELRGGIAMSSSEMDALCIRWLKERGGDAEAAFAR
jgi:hypothetical protein